MSAKGKIPAAPVAVVAAAPVAVGAKNPSHHTYEQPDNTRVVRTSTSGGKGGRGGGGGLTHGKNVAPLQSHSWVSSPGGSRPAKGKQTKAEKRVQKDNIRGVSKGAIRRMAYRGGVRRISGIMYEETRGILKKFVERIVKDSVTYTEYSNRTTVTVLDVLYALRKRNKHLYGYDY